MDSLIIRPATPEDCSEILGIYSYYVENTAISYEYAVPSYEEFRQRIATTLEKFPYLVLEEDGKFSAMHTPRPSRPVKPTDIRLKPLFILKTACRKGDSEDFFFRYWKKSFRKEALRMPMPA